MRFADEFREGMWISWDAIRANKLRSVLTTLGIVIGIVTVTLMGTALNGLNAAFLTSVQSLGADVLYVQRFGWFIDSHEEWIKAERRREINLAQVKALEKQMTLARAIAPMADSRAPVKFRDRNASGVTIVGTSDQFVFTGGIVVSEGRFFTAGENDSGRQVCVIGAQVATNLFIHEPALGQRIRLGPDQYEVIGVIEKQGDMFGPFSRDNHVIVPVKAFMADFWPRPDFQIQVRVRDVSQLDDAREEIRGLMRKIRHVAPGDEDDFSIDEQEAFLNMFKRVTRTMGMVGFFITGLSLFVGGIGIMNIMFVSVAERTCEIGIRKAIGAKQRAILIQFLTEAASICLIGGLIGLGIAWPGTLVMGKFLPAKMSPVIVGIALLVAAVTGVVSGFFPAWRAAKMNPVDALRNE
ncbi:MAG: ABC transporter permease [Verrucomicrobia bacterium]|nr:ABC transporter permease [Verrucomicrobiota bacterium]